MRGSAKSPWRHPVGPGPTRGGGAGPRLTMPEEVLLARRLELLGLSRPRALRVTDNRSVMVSLSPRGVLSIHRGYARAPDRVLRAVVRFLAPGTTRAMRRAAEHEILSFRPEVHAAGPPRRRRSADRPRAGDAEKGEQLGQLFALYNRRHFGGALPAVPIRISGRMRTRLAQLCLRHRTGEPYEITMSRSHIDRHGWPETGHTLLHEMVHLWQHATGRPVDHGPAFRRKAEEIGVAASARRVIGPGGRRGRAARVD